MAGKGKKKGEKGMSPFKAGLLVLVLAVIVVYLGFTKQIPFQHHYTIQAVFPTANNIRKASPVRIAGVEVGKVTQVSRLKEGRPGAVVTMEQYLKAPIIFLGLSLPEHGYHAKNENFDWGMASGGMKMFVRYFDAISRL